MCQKTLLRQKNGLVHSDENEVNMSRAITKLLLHGFWWNLQEKILKVLTKTCEIFRQIGFVWKKLLKFKIRGDKWITLYISYYHIWGRIFWHNSAALGCVQGLRAVHDGGAKGASRRHVADPRAGELQDSVGGWCSQRIPCETAQRIFQQNGHLFLQGS